MSFYKVENGCLWEGNHIKALPHYELKEELKDTYEYPVFGWRWFDSEEEAREFFGLPEIQEEDNDYHNE